MARQDQIDPLADIFGDGNFGDFVQAFEIGQLLFGNVDRRRDFPSRHARQHNRPDARGKKLGKLLGGPVFFVCSPLTFCAVFFRQKRTTTRQNKPHQRNHSPERKEHSADGACIG